MAPPVELPQAWQSLGEAFLIGLLVGIQREGIAAPRTAHLAGLRDFVILALTGAVCALVQASALTIAALASVTGILLVHAYRHPERAPGITTELAAVATFCLGYLTALPGFAHGATLAIGAAIGMVAILEAKKNLHRLVRQELTEVEFTGTLRFLAIIFIIYPLLPKGEFGPYGFFSPRRIWLFVILVSSLSYVGYFLKRFLGERGLNLTAVLGGIASTTAATASLARGAAESPDQVISYSTATVLANAIQLPRVLTLLYLIRPELANASAVVMLGMMGAGVGFAWILSRKSENGRSRHPVTVGNPFRLAPALKFGALFTGLLWVSKWAAASFGERGVNIVAVAGGAVDVDAVTVAVADLLGAGRISTHQSLLAVLLALASNAALKTVLATTGGLQFVRWVAAGFLVIYSAGFVLFWLL